MGLYGITQQLGSGTFSFDRICPNRYLLDRLANEDSVLPSRYALVEYDKLIAKVEKPEADAVFNYEEGKKQYDIIPMKDGKIDMSEGSIEYIFVCSDPELNDENAGKYNFYYIDNDNRNFHLYGIMEPSEFNKEVDRAYAQKDSTDDISSDLAELWDSTAWLKIINESKFKYIKVANLNVVIPSFTVESTLPTFNIGGDQETDDEPEHNQPEVTSTNESGVFNIDFPKFPDIKLSVNKNTNDNIDDNNRIITTYKSSEINFKLNLPEITMAIEAADAANQAATNANAAAANVGDNIKEVFTSNQVIIDWAIDTPQHILQNVKIPISNKPSIINASDLQSLWDNIS